MLLYLLETLIGIPLVALHVRLLAPAQEEVIGATLPPKVELSDRQHGNVLAITRLTGRRRVQQ